MDFIWQCVLTLLGMDIVYFVVISLAILVVCWLVQFVIQLVQDKYDG